MIATRSLSKLSVLSTSARKNDAKRNLSCQSIPHFILHSLSIFSYFFIIFFSTRPSSPPSLPCAWRNPSFQYLAETGTDKGQIVNIERQIMLHDRRVTGRDERSGEAERDTGSLSTQLEEKTPSPQLWDCAIRQTG